MDARRVTVAEEHEFEIQRITCVTCRQILGNFMLLYCVNLSYLFTLFSNGPYWRYLVFAAKPTVKQLALSGPPSTYFESSYSSCLQLTKFVFVTVELGFTTYSTCSFIYMIPDSVYIIDDILMNLNPFSRLSHRLLACVSPPFRRTTLINSFKIKF